MYETEHDNDVAMLIAVIETAADAIDTEGVIRLLCELTDACKSVAKLAERNVELALDSANRDREFDRLVAAIDAERADYRRSLEFRDKMILDRDEAIADLEFRIASHDDAVKQCADKAITALAQGAAIAEAVNCYWPKRDKIRMVKSLRDRTGLSLLESKLICEQIYTAIEETKEAVA